MLEAILRLYFLIKNFFSLHNAPLQTKFFLEEKSFSKKMVSWCFRRVVAIKREERKKNRSVKNLKSRRKIEKLLKEESWIREMLSLCIGLLIFTFVRGFLRIILLLKRLYHAKRFCQKTNSFISKPQKRFHPFSSYSPKKQEGVNLYRKNLSIAL